MSPSSILSNGILHRSISSFREETNPRRLGCNFTGSLVSDVYRRRLCVSCVFDVVLAPIICWIVSAIMKWALLHCTWWNTYAGHFNQLLQWSHPGLCYGVCIDAIVTHHIIFMCMTLTHADNEDCVGKLRINSLVSLLQNSFSVLCRYYVCNCICVI